MGITRRYYEDWKNHLCALRGGSNRFELLIEEATEPKKYYEKHLQQATEIFKHMIGLLGQIQFAKFSNDVHEAREACWGLIIRTTEIVSHVNRRSLTTNWGVNLKELFTFEASPKRFTTTNGNACNRN